MFYLDEVVQATVREEKKLMVENAKLKKEIEELKRQLLEKERRRGGKCTRKRKSLEIQLQIEHLIGMFSLTR